jgi:hypothetical protein
VSRLRSQGPSPSYSEGRRKDANSIQSAADGSTPSCIRPGISQRSNTISAPGGQKPYIKVFHYEQGKEPKFFFINSYILDWGKGKDGREVKMVDVSPDGRISLSLFEGNSYIVAVETDPWSDKVECGMAKVDISSQPADPLRIVIDRKGRCDEKAFAKMLDAEIKK